MADGTTENDLGFGCGAARTTGKPPPPFAKVFRPKCAELSVVFRPLSVRRYGGTVQMFLLKLAGRWWCLIVEEKSLHRPGGGTGVVTQPSSGPERRKKKAALLYLHEPLAVFGCYPGLALHIHG
jgi:hypothetical protein